MNSVFYLKNKGDRYKKSIVNDGTNERKVATIAARFLSYNEKFLPDPNSDRARKAIIYSDAEGKLTMANANPNGYFIVPANYSIAKAIVFSNTVSSMIVCNGISSAYGMMVGAFMPNGSQDLQRTYPESDGQNPGDFVQEFTDAASFHFGFVAEYSGIGEHAALVGGGSLNELHWYENSAKNLYQSLSGGELLFLPDTSGAAGNNPDNVRSIHAGASFASELQQRYGIHTPELCYAPF